MRVNQCRCDGRGYPDHDVVEPDEVTFGEFHEQMTGAVMGPIVLPNTDSSEDAKRTAFESEKEVREWAHEAGLDYEEVRGGAAKPFVAIQEIADGWIVWTQLMFREPSNVSD